MKCGSIVMTILALNTHDRNKVCWWAFRWNRSKMVSGGYVDALTRLVAENGWSTLLNTDRLTITKTFSAMKKVIEWFSDCGSMVRARFVAFQFCCKQQSLAVVLHQQCGSKSTHWFLLLEVTSSTCCTSDSSADLQAEYFLDGSVTDRTEVRDLKKHRFRPPNVARFCCGRPANYRCCWSSDLHLVQW